MSDSPILAVSIRPYTSDDLEGMLAIENRSYPIPWTREHFQDEEMKPYSTMWVLTDDETDSRVFGYAVFWTMDDTIEILNIVIDLESRGLGWAKLILQKVIREGLAKGVKRLILDVRKSNLPAFGLYQRAGFSITQIRKGFYANGEDGYHMTLALDGATPEF